MNSLVSKAKNRERGWGAYPNDEAYFYPVLDKYPVKGKSVLVVGTEIPWVEALLLGFGCTNITTVDFILLKIDYPGVTTITVPQLNILVNDQRKQWDVVVSYSSLEHDGLGRYGDPLSPNGDLIRMKELYELLKDNGIIMLGVPLGKDSLVWNAHRIYGNIRFPMMMEGFEVMEMHTDRKYTPSEISGLFSNSGFIQGVIVAKKLRVL